MILYPDRSVKPVLAGLVIGTLNQNTQFIHRKKLIEEVTT
jgi:hypothetical protein